MSNNCVAVSAVLALMATACVGSPQIGDELSLFRCGTHDGGWRLIDIPENASLYRQRAEMDSPYRSKNVSADMWGRYSDETWLENEAGEKVLCLTDGPPSRAWGSTFWRFEPYNGSTDGPIIADKGATVVVG